VALGPGRVGVGGTLATVGRERRPGQPAPGGDPDAGATDAGATDGLVRAYRGRPNGPVDFDGRDDGMAGPLTDDDLMPRTATGNGEHTP